MNIPTAILYFGAGAVAALLHLLVLWLTAAALVRRRTMMPLLLGSIARLGFLLSLALVAFWVRIGPLELISALAGFLAVRILVLFAVPAAAQPSKPGPHRWR